MSVRLVVRENPNFRDLDGACLELSKDRLTWKRMVAECTVLRGQLHNGTVYDFLAFRYAVRRLSEFEILHDLGGLMRFGTESSDSKDV